MKSKKILKIGLSVLSTTLFIVLNCCFSVFAATKNTNYSDLTNIDYSSLTQEDVMSVLAIYGIFILVIFVIAVLLCIPYMKKIHQPIWKVFIPIYGEYVIYSAGGNGLGLLYVVGSLISAFFMPILTPLLVPICNFLLTKKFTNYENNYFAVFLAIVFGPLAIGFGNHNYKG